MIIEIIANLLTADKAETPEKKLITNSEFDKIIWPNIKYLAGRKEIPA